jgi:glucose-1-phosphate cytidylyltransferase
MKTVILAGGYGTRISEESLSRPKPMIELNGQPVLWHIMKSYSYYGFHDFIICAGYKQQVIKEYFANYYLYRSDITFDFTSENAMTIHNNVAEPWKVTIVDTGLDTLTGGRIKRIRDYIGQETFLLTYGDGVCDVNIREVVQYHKKQGKLATLTAIQPGGRFGTLEISPDGRIERFAEKDQEAGGWINGGYMALEPQVFDYIANDQTTFEREPLERLSREGNLAAYKYHGFWQCMDTMKDKMYLEGLLTEGKAPWMVWEKKDGEKKKGCG